MFSSIPGIITIFITAFTDKVIIKASYHNNLIYTFGSLFPLFLSMFGIYLIGAFLILLYKSISIENESFRYNIVYMIVGFIASSVSFILLSIVYPFVLNIHTYSNIGISLFLIIILLISNKAFSSERPIDFIHFYIILLYRSLLAVIIFVPVYIMLEYSKKLPYINPTIYEVGNSLILFLFLFLFFRFVRPYLKNLFFYDNRKMEEYYNATYKEIAKISEIDYTDNQIDSMFNLAINALQFRFNISEVTFFLYNSHENTYSYSYGFGRMPVEDISEDSELIQFLKQHPSLVEKSMFYTDDKLQKYKQSILDIFNQKNIFVILPLFNREDELIALFLLGRQYKGKPYYDKLLSFLDIYRIHFEVALENSIILKEIKASQTLHHDKIVMDVVKKKIIPKKLTQVKGIRLSSFFQNNSELGIDFFDSLIIGRDKLGIFMTCIGNNGIDSATFALEIYSILHSKAIRYDSPELLLNNMNRVITSSRFSKIYAPAIFVVYSTLSGELRYSSAAFNPLLLFDTEKNSIQELDTEGIPIGIDSNFYYKFQSIRIQPNSIGIIYSNGITSAINKDGKNYSTERIIDLLKKNKNDSSAILVRKIYDDYKNFTESSELIDDSSLIVFRTE
ncbi:MAG: PP2C family protein-serine/threonine phosphatase [Spirochaetota bacterium]|nr:PP2C family protein-serine/threonine phosphatase [Spirochaetota bacterium]